MTDDELLFLAAAELAAMRRLVELERLRNDRLAGRVAGRTDKVVVWVETDAEEEDEELRAALTEFMPSAWWRL